MTGCSPKSALVVKYAFCLWVLFPPGTSVTCWSDREMKYTHTSSLWRIGVKKNILTRVRP